MRNVLARLRDWFNPPTVESDPEKRIILRIPVSLRQKLAEATAPRDGLLEPMALLRARYVAEGTRDVVVATGVIAFPDDAYRGARDAATAFDTQWLIETANKELAINAGIVLVHSHGGDGVPRFSSVDGRTNRELMAPLSIGVSTAPYGAMVLSNTSQYALLAFDGQLRAADVDIVYDAQLKGWIA